MSQQSFSEAINEALKEVLKDPQVLLMGEGVPDPKRIFGTTKGLKELYPSQVFDQPVSEAGATGILIGASLNGFSCIQTHQRIDFSLYAMDQIVNNAAKWHSMFGFQKTVPLTIRMIIGRGWGQGNQHSQNLEALFAHVPGLHVYIPHDAPSAKRLLIKAVNNPHPVIYIEHKWLYNKRDEQHSWAAPNPELTIVSWGYAASEAEQAAFHTLKHMDVDLVILGELKPLDMSLVLSSVKKSKRLLVVNDSWEFAGIPAEIITQVVSEVDLIAKPMRITYPNHYTPSSHMHSQAYYPKLHDIITAINRLTGRNIPLIKREGAHDVDPFVGHQTAL